MNLLDELGNLEQDCRKELEAAKAAGAAALEKFRVKYLGSNGRLKLLYKRMGEVPKDLKPATGQKLNALSSAVTERFEAAKSALDAGGSGSAPRMDITEPLPPEQQPAFGRLHPLTRTVDGLRGLLRPLGFEVVDGPEIEDRRHNFDDLNIPADHPSRDSFDTFFLADREHLLRSQTSTVQIRIMEQLQRKPPLRVIAPGRVYRPDRIDATHASTFHQIEGLYVDRKVSMKDLRGTLQAIVEGLYGKGTRLRFRPSFFPFTEPSAEVDCTLTAFDASGNRRDLGWVEMGGCGMVDPAVFEAVNRARGDQAYDPELWTGFAFGFGIERLCMRRHSVTDIRLFLENDLRFLRQI